MIAPKKSGGLAFVAADAANVGGKGGTETGRQARKGDHEAWIIVQNSCPVSSIDSICSGAALS